MGDLRHTDAGVRPDQVAAWGAAEARLQAYSLMERTQTDDHHGCRVALTQLRDRCLRHDWYESAFLASTGLVVHDFVHGADRDVLRAAVTDLVATGERLDTPGAIGVALGIRALYAGGAHDSARVFADAGRAVALMEASDVPALERAFTWVACGAAYSQLSLWELADDMYDRADALAPQCEEPWQQVAVVVNRVLMRLEWATALFELDDRQGALAQVHQVADAVDEALGMHGVPAQWQRSVAVARDLAAFVLEAYADIPPAAAVVDAALVRLAQHREDLLAVDDQEVAHLVDGFTALALLRLGRTDDAATWALRDTPVSASTGARTFRLWVRAELAYRRGEVAEASREYGVLVGHLRWKARLGMLAAARSSIAEERLSTEHARLTLDVMTDPLTGLLNRRAFDAWLDEPGDPDRVTALLIVDVDAFKAVNDRHGHAVGDETLRRIGSLLQHYARAGDLAIRLGGDEFVLIMTAPALGVDGLARAAHARAEDLRTTVAGEGWTALSDGLDVAVSVGVATGEVHAAGDADELYRRADADLYLGKGPRLTALRPPAVP